MPSPPMSFAYRKPFPTIRRSALANRPASKRPFIIQPEQSRLPRCFSHATASSTSVSMCCCKSSEAIVAMWFECFCRRLVLGIKIVPNHSAFWKRNDSRVTLSSSRNAVSLSSAVTMNRFPLSRCASATNSLLPLQSASKADS
jgi:hypothetical protein